MERPGRASKARRPAATATPFLCETLHLGRSYRAQEDRLKRKEEGAKKQIKNFFFLVLAGDDDDSNSRNGTRTWTGRNIIIIFNFHPALTGHTRAVKNRKLSRGGRFEIVRPMSSWDRTILRWLMCSMRMQWKNDPN